LPHAFFIAFDTTIEGLVWSGVGSEVLWVWGGDGYGYSWIGDGCDCSRIRDERDCSRIRDEDGHVSGKIEAGTVFGWLAMFDSEAAIDGSTSIEVLH
jgi:hypothetical protein